MHESRGSEGSGDRAYAEASEMLGEDAVGRARRRDAVLAAVRAASEGRRGRETARVGRGWLTAAAVAGLSVVAVLVARVEEEADLGRSGAGSTERVASRGDVEQQPVEVPGPPAASTTRERAPTAEVPKARSAREAKPPAAAAQGQEVARGEDASMRAEAGRDRPGQTQAPSAAAAMDRQESVAQSNAAGAGLERAPPAISARAPHGSEMSAAKAQRGPGGDVRLGLTEAARAGDERRVKELLDGGASTEDRDRDGDTALLKAVREGHYGTAEILVRAGADRGARGRDGMSAEELSEVSNDKRMKTLLGR